MYRQWTVTGRSLYSTERRLDPKSLLCDIGKNMLSLADVVKFTFLKYFLYLNQRCIENLNMKLFK